MVLVRGAHAALLALPLIISSGSGDAPTAVVGITDVGFHKPPAELQYVTRFAADEAVPLYDAASGAAVVAAVPHVFSNSAPFRTAVALQIRERTWDRSRAGSGGEVSGKEEARELPGDLESSRRRKVFH